MADISNITVSAEGVDTVCKIKDKVARNDIAINRTTLGVQCKNLLKNNAVTQTVSGITFTVNDDYSITLNGTATAIIWLQVGYTKGEHFRKEKLIFTGNPSGTGSGNGLEAWYLNSTTGNKYVSIANGNILTESEYDSSGVIVYEFHIAQGRTYNNVTYYPMLRYADITDDTYEPYKESVDERLIQNKSDIAVNKTTLGTQCKNLLDWKNATYSTSLRLTQTKTESNISVTSTGSWAVTAYKLPVLEVGTNYIFSTTISDLSVAGGKAYVVISTSTSSSNIVKAAEITINGTATIKFEATSDTMYVLFYPNYSNTVYTNSFTASDIMLRYADILGDTYEPYQPSLKEQVPYSISLPSKSTSESYSYNGVPTMICLTPSESVSSGGGLYLINSVGTAVYLIDKTGIVINTDTTNKTFTITNNTASTYDVYISCAYKKE